MKLYAISNYDTIQKVNAKDLRRLIAEGKILAFKRAEGWVKIGRDPIRGDGGEYGGPERREIRQNPEPEANGFRCYHLPSDSDT